MRISLIVISVIIALQATSLINGARQRYVYHNTIHQISNLISPFTQSLKAQKTAQPCNCYEWDEEIRIAIIAFMYSSAFLLFTGEAVFPAVISQLFWIVFESYLCTDRTLPNIRNFFVQIFILYVLVSHLKCCQDKQSRSQRQSNNVPAPGPVVNKQSMITGRSQSINLSKKQSENSKNSQLQQTLNKKTKIQKTASKGEKPNEQPKQQIKTKKTK